MRNIPIPLGAFQVVNPSNLLSIEHVLHDEEIQHFFLRAILACTGLEDYLRKRM